MNAFVPVWHPPEGGFAGGFLRARRILEIEDGFDAHVVDTDSTDILRENLHGTLRTVPCRWAYARSGLPFRAMRAINWFWAALNFTLLGLLSRHRIDFVYVPFSEVLPCAIAGFVVAKVRRIPLIYCNLNVRGTTLWGINRRLHAHADAIITISQSLARDIRAEGIDAPIHIGTVGVDDESVAPRAALYDAIFVGRHTPHKGIFDLLQIWKQCCDASPGLRLASVGPCEPDMRAALIAKAQLLGIENNIEILGAVPEERKWHLYASSRVCIFPSRVEGWGIVPIEAHLAGLPVVAYNLAAYRETIAESPAAFLVDVGDIDRFASGTLQALRGPNATENARNWARQFSWTKAATIELELIRTILNGARANRNEGAAGEATK
ncbi:MAG: glycosyltransferase [Candidatus Eremiobacteraeota bacterium]|nr:glycosyltransferase [Candidatus Eremiobacteraeota bacterium]